MEQMEDNQYVGGKASYNYQHPMTPNEVSGTSFAGEECVKGRLCVTDHLDWDF